MGLFETCVKSHRFLAGPILPVISVMSPQPNYSTHLSHSLGLECESENSYIWLCDLRIRIHDIP